MNDKLTSSVPVEYMYRYTAERYSVTIDAEREIYGTSRPRLVLHKFTIVAETPKGVWISWWLGGKDRWVSNTSRKRFAHRTEAEALGAYKKRKLAYVRHCTARLRRAQEDLALLQPTALELGR